MKRLIRWVLFRLSPEKAHHFSLLSMRILHRLPFGKKILRSLYCVEDPSLERELFGLTFKNPVGLAAGFDKDATIYNELSNFGFGFIEIGTVTPKEQSGNPQPRLFRLVEDEGIINRMGFNNDGVDAARLRLEKRESNLIIGGNIGKNKSTSNDEAVDDYTISFERLFPVVDYFVINVSSPNTPNLRDLQEKAPLTALLNQLQALNHSYDHPKPILLKIAPDLSGDQLRDIIDIVKITKIDGVIATNTTLNRDGLHSSHQNEVGGLSGRPLTKRSTEVIRFLAQESNHAFPIIGVGGIHSAEDALEKLNAGASLIQLYSGFIYEGPQLIKNINQKLIDRENKKA